MEVESIQAQEITVGDEPDFYRETWARAQLPGAIGYRLEQVDRRLNAALSLAEMMGAHIRGKADEADNEGVRYAWLNDRQAFAIADAARCLLETSCEDMERVRQDAIFNEGKLS